MHLFLGVDGGGTGCRAAIADDAGRILGRSAGGPANIASDRAGAADNILSVASAALAASGSQASLSDLAAGLGLAGANSAGAVAWLAQRLPFARLRVETDAVAAARGALGGKDGVVAAIGTGSVFAAQTGGHVREIGGKGLALGDEGSGAWLGRALLSRCLRALDGYPDTPMSPLLAQVLADLGGQAGVLAFAVRATPADFATLSPRVTGSDDPAAEALLAAGTTAVEEALQLLSGNGPRRAVFLGGLGAVYAARLAPRWLSCEPVGTALDGALILAREAV